MRAPRSFSVSVALALLCAGALSLTLSACRRAFADRAPPDLSVLREGDIIFHESRSQQARAVAEVQGSSFTHVGLLFRRRGAWVVLEAIEPVRYTSLDRFVARGGAWRVMRHRGDALSGDELRGIRRAAESFLGRHYDTRFEWSDARIYCSELVAKAYRRGADIDLGGAQDWSELDLSGPYARQLVRARGGAPRGTIVTPAALLESDALVLVAGGS